VPKLNVTCFAIRMVKLSMSLETLKMTYYAYLPPSSIVE